MSFKFSIVTAVYNVELYLEECIQSVINQTIGFEENVQLILVNDGTPDNSEEICIKYRDLYPQNIIYIKKENGGVSSARNEGMKYVQGKYMNFLDSDDKLDEGALEVVYNFFEEVYDYTDVVSIPVEYFEAKSGGHILNYKYKKTRLINLLKEYNYPQLFTNSAFIKSEYKEVMRFNENMRYAEDAELINKILLNKATMGVVSGTCYWYRYRANESSAIQTGTKRKEWYLDYLKYFSQELIKDAYYKKDFIPKFIQYVIMYDLQWRFKLEKLDDSILDSKEKELYKETLKEILKSIEPKIILEQKNISIYHKIYALRLKFGNQFSNKVNKIFYPHNLELLIEDENVCSVYNERIKIDFFEVINDKVVIEGCVGKLIPDEKYEIVIKLGDQLYPTVEVDRTINDELSLDEIIKEYHGFKAEIDISHCLDNTSLKFYVKINNTFIRPQLQLGKFVRINQDLPKSYFSTSAYTIVFMYNSFNILKKSFKVSVGREYRLIKELCKKREYKIVAIRMLYFILKKLQRNPIWLFMDRVTNADDNAEHLFKFAIEQDDKIDKYFILSEDSTDYARMKAMGKVVRFNSMQHKLLLLLSENVISSHIEDNIRVPFRGNGRYLRDLVDFKFTFLQHGITKDNLSGWLNKYNKNINLFITAVNQEYDSILEEGYGYDESVVKLTGFPRYDGLKNNSKKQILIMPTWRKDVVPDLDQNTGSRPYSDSFKESEYFKRYNELINNDELIHVAKEKGYKIVFVPHPCIVQQIEDFTQHKEVIFASEGESYQKLFNESDILITDYSSVAFDFAYLKKPVIYYQYDRDTFFKGHTYTEGYFDYDTMGFGEVCYKIDEIIECIRKNLELNNVIEEKYRYRISEFYKYQDQGNRKRVYEEILKLNRGKYER